LNDPAQGDNIAFADDGDSVLGREIYRIATAMVPVPAPFQPRCIENAQAGRLEYMLLPHR
jgi:hypothetical protein